MKGIGILPKGRYSYIDHLVPLCQIVQIPLLVMERSVKELIEFYYPSMEILLHDQEDYCLDEILYPFDTFFYVDPFRLPHGHFQFADYFTKKKARSVYSMHGNSDKKWKTYWIEQLADEDILLLYGPQSVDFLRAKGVDKSHIHAGNYRLEYYQHHQKFFDDKFFFKKEKTTLLYAPTWTSKNKKSEWRFDYSSFFEAHKFVFENIPDSFQLIVKMHPLYNALMQEEEQKIKEEYPHVHFLEDFPLIYPLLQKIDIYLGDFSSIGYDFLYFQKPMFFLNFEEKPFLQKCGCSISKEQMPHLYDIISEKQKLNFEAVQKSTYLYAFGEKKDLSLLKKEIESACA